jgi:nucleoside-triphosphatase
VIDEIGNMECYSRKFKELTAELLSSDRPVVATIPLKGAGLIASIKARSDVELIEITRNNRDNLPRLVLHAVSMNVQS